jgi:release factor glutamine methyltransferase
MPDVTYPASASIQNSLSLAADKLSAVSDSAVLDAEVLLSFCLHKTRSFLRAWPDKLLSAEQLESFWHLVQKRQQGQPIAYLTGEREFWSRSFMVSPDVLIPRPDSELLIEISLGLFCAQQIGNMLDLGTGSGILGITLAAERPSAKVIAIDKSTAALQVAQANAKQLNVSNIQFLQSNWFEAIVDTAFDLIISNPPYIPADDPHLQQGDVRFEPQTALVSADNGLKDIRILAAQARNHLTPGGHLLIEHGYNQQNAVQDIFNAFNYQQVATHHDLSGNPRVTSGLWNPA